jgi:hypothetical protein
LVGKADAFFAAGKKVPHVLFLIKVDTQTAPLPIARLQTCVLPPPFFPTSNEWYLGSARCSLRMQPWAATR